MRAFVFAAALLAAPPALAQSPDVAPVVAAERAFAADAPGMGIVGSFNKWAAPDAVVIGPRGVQPVAEAYPPDTARPADEPSLVWWPTFAGIAYSGDLGFTTGAVEVNGRRTGHYFTIWKRQADGSWRWVYDGGSGASSATAPGPETEPEVLPVSTGGTGSADKALAEVAFMEAFMARGVLRFQKVAHLRLMTEDGRIYVAPHPPAIGREAAAEALTSWPETFEFSGPEGFGASAAGDLAWTYGTARWVHEEEPRHGYYVHLWQKGAGGWGLVLAQLIPAPPLPPSPPPPPAGG
ncbi:hypothetical protein [Brevundimonas sp.]|uniref:hypothetical protein n=1 Tax=Brevundimonas sp. TaxID=1871086 RepID=UPI002C5F4EB6|nr:hypothetical protein [Brevundimonas sp.]HWQ85443.1 hypothetical protein [Brevundimonas sp.]